MAAVSDDGSSSTRAGTGAGSSKPASTATPKNFVCTRAGCNKRFTRDEHLQRHALNHTAGDYTCSRCRAHFKRPDLLSRHLQRHRQRDLEVGAEGYGVLNTRKRAWKALDGTVVQKKPQLTTPATPPEVHEVHELHLLHDTATSIDTSTDTSTGPSSEWADRLILAAGHINTTYHNNNNNLNTDDNNNTTVDALYAAEATISPAQTQSSSAQLSSTHSSSSCQSDLADAEAEQYDVSQSQYEYDQSRLYLDPALEHQQQQHQQQQKVQFTSIPPFASVSIDSIAGVGTGAVDSTSYTQRPVAPEPQQQQPPPPPLDFLFDDVFQPDTASSFNMPYTTAINYNWLFSMDDNTIDSTNIAESSSRPVQSSQTMQTMHQQMSLQSLQEQQQEQRQTNADMSLDYLVISPASGSGSSQTLVFDDPRHNITSPPMMHTAPPSQSYQSHVEQDRPSGGIFQEKPVPPPSMPGTERLRLERPLSSIHPVHAQHFPVIDQETRERLLQVVDACHPALPDGQLSTWDHPLLALDSLQDFYHLFFSRFNTAYPLLHQATFHPSETEPLLLLAVVLLGTTYSSKEAHQLAVCIHDVMRPRIFAHTDFGAKPNLWMLQTILLVECFGKSRAGQKQHDMSHLFHGLLINLIRRSDCQSARPSVPVWSDHDHETLTSEKVEEAWKKWAVQEEMKRLALLCFMWDTQHAVLFCQSLCMSAFELRLTLPCSQVLWESRTAAEWKRTAMAEQGPGQDLLFLTALKMYMTPPTTDRPSTFQQLNLNALSRVLLLHGLLSISWDMERRDQTALGVVDGANAVISSQSGRDWRDRMADAYNRWKTDFDTYCADLYVCQQRQQHQHRQHELKGDQTAGDKTATPTTQHLEAAARECSTFATAYKAVYHAAHILLNSDFLDVQIYAGARHILGRPVQRGDFIRSERVIKRWAAAQVHHDGDATPAAKAAWHAACLVHDAARHLDDFDAMGLFHVPWCLYIATLTCWVFHHTRPRPTDNSSWSSRDDSSEIVWDARQEMDELVSNMARAQPSNLTRAQGQQQTGGLVWVMANVLSNVRWGIVHAGVVVLRGLVPLRMINQYEVA